MQLPFWAQIICACAHAPALTPPALRSRGIVSVSAPHVTVAAAAAPAVLVCMQDCMPAHPQPHTIPTRSHHGACHNDPLLGQSKTPAGSFFWTRAAQVGFGGCGIHGGCRTSVQRSSTRSTGVVAGRSRPRNLRLLQAHCREGLSLSSPCMRAGIELHGVAVLA
jgi:hypothetical protein